MQTVYEEPEDELDTSGDLDWLFKDNGKAIIQDKATLPPRQDLIHYSKDLHQKELEGSIQWRDCPDEHRSTIRTIIEAFWDVFDPDGMQRPVRGFEFNIDTGQMQPICCREPTYGHHEKRVIKV
jgi:hypothetical protein